MGSHRWITVLVAVSAGILVVMALEAALLALYVWPSVTQESFLAQVIKSEEPLPPAIPAKATVAIAPFANQSSDDGYEWLGYAVAYGMASRLANFPELVIAHPGEIREGLANEQSDLTLSDINRPADAQEAGAAVWAEYVIIGSFTKSDDEMRVAAQIVEVATGNIRSERAGLRKYAKIFDLYAELVMWAAEALDLTTYPAKPEKIKYAPTQSLSAYQCFGQGLMHFYRGECEQAVAACQEAVDIDSNFADAYVVLAWVLVCQEEYGEAIAQLKKVRKLDAERPYLHYYLGIAYRENEDYDEAVDELRQTVERKPQDIKVWRALGAAYLASADNHYYNFCSYRDADESYPATADCRRAKDVFSEALQLDPALADVYVCRAEAYYGMCDYEAAIVDCNRAIEINPRLAAAYTTRGDAYDEIGDYDKALDDYDHSLSLEPSADAYQLRAYLHMENENYEKAIADYTRALELDPNHCMTYNNRAATYVEIGEYDLAISDVNRGLELDPNHVLLVLNRAWAYYKKGDWDHAIPDATRTIEIDPVNRCSAYYWRASAYYGKGDYKRSLADWTYYLELLAANHKHDASALANRATVYRKLGEYDKALTDANEALQADPNRASTYAVRAQIYYDMGHYEQAWDDTRTALGKSAECSSGYTMRARLHVREGNCQEAIADYKRALEYEKSWEQPDTFCELAKLHKELGQLSVAREYVQKTLERLPEHKEAQELLDELDRLVQ